MSSLKNVREDITKALTEFPEGLDRHRLYDMTSAESPPEIMFAILLMLESGEVVDTEKSGSGPYVLSAKQEVAQAPAGKRVERPGNLQAEALPGKVAHLLYDLEKRDKGTFYSYELIRSKLEREGYRVSNAKDLSRAILRLIHGNYVEKATGIPLRKPLVRWVRGCRPFDEPMTTHS